MQTTTTNATQITALEISQLGMALEDLRKHFPEHLTNEVNYNWIRVFINNLAQRLPTNNA
jgi:hypothetical protein